MVRPQQLALGASIGVATLHNSTPGASIGSLLPLRQPFEPFSPEHDEDVQVSTLDAFCAVEGISRIDLLKIDVEGLEFAVLTGAKKLIDASAINAIQFEFGVGNFEARTFFRDFFDLLGDRYDFYRIVSDGLRRVPRYHSELEQHAAINYLAVLRATGWTNL